jgi:hypothetical protein
LIRLPAKPVVGELRGETPDPPDRVLSAVHAGDGQAGNQLVGTSSKGWEEAVSNAIDRADGKLTNMRIAEVVEMDTKLVEGKIVQFRAKVRLSFKHEVEPETL